MAHFQCAIYRLKKAEQLLKYGAAKQGDMYSKKRAFLWEDLAAAWFRLGNLSRLESALQQKAALEPGCADSYLNLGFYYTQIGLTDKARDAYLKGLSVNPRDEYIIYNLASLYQTEGQRQEALILLDKAMLAEQANGNLLKAKADLLLLWKRPDLAAPVYELALANLSGYSLGIQVEAIHSLAACYLAEDDINSAAKTWKRALELDGKDQEAIYNLVLFYNQLQNSPKVIEYGSRYQGEHSHYVKRLIFKAHSRMEDMRRTLQRIADNADAMSEGVVRELMARGKTRAEAEEWVNDFL